MLGLGEDEQILQVGVAPNRIDLLRRLTGVEFSAAWDRRIEGRYGSAPANWIHIEDLLRIKESIDEPRHREDARVLREILRRRSE